MNEHESFRARQEAAQEQGTTPLRAQHHEQSMRAYLSGALYPATYPAARKPGEAKQATTAEQPPPQPVDEPAPPASRRRRFRRRP